MIMAEGHIIIIKEQDKKKEYLTHLKAEKDLEKEELKRKEQKKKQEKVKKANSANLNHGNDNDDDIDSEEFEEIMAEGDLVLIGED